MAEINIQRKAPSAWPWIIGALLLALVVWGIAEWFDPDQPGAADVTIERNVTPPAERQPMPAPVPTRDAGMLVAQYAQFASSFPTSDENKLPELAAEGLRRLVLAMDAVIQDRQMIAVDVERRFDSFRQAAAGIQENGSAREMRAGQVKTAFTSATDALEEMVDESTPVRPDVRGAVAETRQAAESIDADQPLSQQSEAVQQFFSSSARALIGLQSGG